MGWHATTIFFHLFAVQFVCLVWCQEVVTINVALWKVPPFVMQQTNPATGEVTYYGLLADLFNEAMRTVNAQNTSRTLKLVYTEYSSSGALVNGSWTGIVGAISRGDMEVALSLNTMLGARSLVVDFVPWISSNFGLLIKKPAVEAQLWAFVQPFSGGMWASLLATCVVFALALWATDRCSPFGHRHGELEMIDSRLLNGPNSFYQSFMNVVGRGDSIGKSWSSKIILFGMSFYSLLVLSHYTALLTTIQTSRLATPTITSIDALVSSKSPVCIVAGSAAYTWIVSSTDRRIQSIASFWTIGATTDACVQLLRDDKVAAVLYGDYILRWYLQQPPCDLMIVGVLEAQGFYGIPINFASPLLHPLKKAVLDLVSSDFLSGLVSTYVPPESCAPYTSDGSSLQVEEMGGAMVIAVLIPVALGLILSGIEKYVYTQRFRQGPHKFWRRANICCGLHYDSEAKWSVYRTSGLNRVVPPYGSPVVSDVDMSHWSPGRSRSSRSMRAMRRLWMANTHNPLTAARDGQQSSK